MHTIEISEELRSYIVEIVRATRPNEKLPADLRGYVEIGAGPRATLAIAQLARAVAFLDDRADVELRDIHAVALPVLRHRVSYTYRVRADDVHSDDLTQRIIASVL